MLELLIGVAIGFFSAFGFDYYKQWQRGKRHWKIVHAAALLCKKRAENYINRTVAAPLYRLPTSAFHEALPVLMSESDLNHTEYTALVEYFSWADDINRGLDYASDAAQSGDHARVKREESRLDKKCKELISVYLPPLEDTLKNRNRLVKKYFGNIDCSKFKKKWRRYAKS